MIRTTTEQAEAEAIALENILRKFGLTIGESGWDRITFHPNLTVKELREIAASYGVIIRQKASRDEVARIMRKAGIAT